MAERVGKNANWRVADGDGSFPSWERVGISVLMDIRDELQKLNGLLSCPNFASIPWRLKEIAGNTKRPKRRKA